LQHFENNKTLLENRINELENKPYDKTNNKNQTNIQLKDKIIKLE
jgi:hypothetical protein